VGRQLGERDRFVVQRATSVNGPWTTLTTTAANATTYTDGTVAKKTAYVYRVVATNVVGLTQTFVALAVGFPHPQMDAAPSNTVSHHERLARARTG
jgi:hypothetical protein